MPPRNFSDQTRSDGFVHFPYCREYYASSFFPYFTKRYNKIDKAIRNTNTIEFKLELSLQLKPHRRKHYSHGPKQLNTLLTHIRIGRSYLNTHSFSIGLSDTNSCSCDDKTPESPLHYMINCPSYAEERRILFDQVEQTYIPNFRKLTQKRKLEILVEGYEPENYEMKKINSKLLKLTQFFILKTKRFSI